MVGIFEFVFTYCRVCSYTRLLLLLLTKLAGWWLVVRILTCFSSSLVNSTSPPHPVPCQMFLFFQGKSDNFAFLESSYWWDMTIERSFFHACTGWMLFSQQQWRRQLTGRLQFHSQVFTGLSTTRPLTIHVGIRCYVLYGEETFNGCMPLLSPPTLRDGLFSMSHHLSSLYDYNYLWLFQMWSGIAKWRNDSAWRKWGKLPTVWTLVKWVLHDFRISFIKLRSVVVEQTNIICNVHSYK